MVSNRLRLIIKTALATTFSLGALGALGAWAVIQGGWYNVAATQQHFQVVHTVLEKAMHQSVRFHAREIAAPPLADAGRVVRGAGLYQQHCLQCHGAPGVAPGLAGMSLQPAPGPLVDAGRRWQARELYWITKHGIKMAGMPAWDFRLREQELWDVVAFLEQLPTYTAARYRAVVASAGEPAPLPPSPPGPLDLGRGRMALTQYACQSCHRIPGVTGPDTGVGPELKGLSQRKYVAGILPNTPDNLARWIRAPQEVHPQSVMPDLGVSERDARNMAAYLLSQD